MEPKKALYNAWIAQLREDKVAETRKKLAVYGYADEDDYHILVPPEGYHFAPRATHANGDFHGYAAWAENYEAMLRSFPPVVVPYSSMAGNFFKILQRFRKLRWHPDLDFSRYAADIEIYQVDHGLGQVHHFCGDVTVGLRLGWGGLLEKVRACAAQNSGTPEKQAFYAAEERVVLAIIEWIRRTSEGIEAALAKESDPDRAENLRGMLAANRGLETEPPTTLREACQFMSWYNMAGRSYNREGCGGQLDKTLQPYYERDIAAGLIDDEDAVFYLAGLLMSDTKYYQLGGPDEAEEDMISQVSWLVLEAADRLDVTANLTVRVHDGLDPAFFRRSVEMLLKHKNAWPRFSGDQSLVSGFVKNGYPAALARRRIAVGCNWMAIPGIEYGLNDSIKVNLAKVFEVAFQEMTEGGECSTQRLWTLYRCHLARALTVVFETTDLHLRTSKDNSPELFLNLFCEGPIEKGRDASYHSVQYYNIAVDGSGIAVAADSFAALEQRVEKEGRLSWVQVAEALRNDYAGQEGEVIRQLLHTAQKFGQWNSLGGRWAERISREFAGQVTAGQSAEGAKFIPGLFSWSKTIQFGKRVGATPDGRKAGAPINHGANPMPGSVPNGEMTTLSEAIVSVQCGMGNTAPFQMELDPGITQAEGGVEKLMALLKTHLDRGGTLINVNIMDAEKVRAAHQNPELYPDLVVRVTGFTAYFISLSPEFRQLVVDRLMEAQ